MDKSTIPPYVTKTSGNTRIKPKLLNIDGSEDPFYRYKMRQLYVQVVGKGKMIKTVLLNIDDVARDLKVAPSYMAAYLGYELGASYKYEPKKPERERASISGDLDATDLSAMVKKFIRELILCSNCNLPEITMSVDKKTIQTSCRSCGEKQTLNLKPKLQQFIINHPVELISKEETIVKKKQENLMKEGSSHAKENDEEIEQAKKKSAKGKKKDDEEDDVEWSVDLSQDAVKQRRRDMQPDSIRAILEAGDQKEQPKKDQKKDPLSELTAFVAINPPDTIAAEVKRLQQEYGFPNSKRAHLLFDVIYENDVVPDVAKYKNTFRDLVQDRPTQMGVLQCLEKFCSGALLKKTASIIKLFYDNDIIDEETIIEWQSNVLKSESIKNEMKPFIKWLKEAEEESEED